MEFQATLAQIKKDMNFIKEVFPETHKTFRITRANAEGLECSFLDSSGQEVKIIASITALEYEWSHQ